MGIRLQQRGGKIGLDRNAVIFVAGEQLTSVDRSLCEKVWDARVVDVYGMAEFDMVGFETASQPGEFSLIPEFGYALLPEQGLPLTSPAIGTIGELLIRAESQAAWHRTGDRVVVKSDFAVERKWRVCFVGRLNESVTLADGTTITSEHVDTLQQSLGFQFVQVIVERGQVADLIRIRVPEDQSRPCSEVETAFANANIDLADAVFYGVAKFRVEFIASGSLTRTPRGKVPRIMMGDSA
jgi:phenylacetate-coenzyme A ligase PaaK-like adenylate-forming protein